MLSRPATARQTSASEMSTPASISDVDTIRAARDTAWSRMRARKAFTSVCCCGLPVAARIASTWSGRSTPARDGSSSPCARA
ncbi:hypothetical protein [Sphingomonas aracearum]|uniref:Uncharacterized protein n=1 Tax=Sphingomonas aracearum TaxID=2283317 RepID=A0A369W1N9_9SPHN|nr:hypothetical protein [Sphingomonas aracearum]RDE07270.1 hypothetical protein DVW87_06485 [Sphingomonas aracearum]